MCVSTHFHLTRHIRSGRPHGKGPEGHIGTYYSATTRAQLRLGSGSARLRLGPAPSSDPTDNSCGCGRQARIPHPKPTWAILTYVTAQNIKQPSTRLQIYLSSRMNNNVKTSLSTFTTGRGRRRAAQHREVPAPDDKVKLEGMPSRAMRCRDM